ncbi:MAG: S1 RNA-binding domain-containing protein, partial [Proteobacteria bacterium]|nr:S1 RNA-binding domain-containing protein [Pseudomonadota bacterium]
MTRRILIDATHSNEIRLALTKDQALSDFYYQNSSQKAIKGDIYLAKITRIEPGLQAAFVYYGKHKHGFLPFSEI